jgi:predicted RNase H-like nuclease
MTLVLGVDGCRGGWCAVPLEVNGGSASPLDARVLSSFVEALASPAEVIGIDIPIGLLDRPGQRACDVEARRILGPGRSSSVFPPPSRRSLPFGDYRTASDMNYQLTGRRLNRQSFNIAPKVREVDDVMKPGMQERVLEVHPELCFQALNGGRSMRLNKKTTAGREARWRLLRAVLPDLRPNPSLPPGLKGRCSADDYVDALVCAWTAMSVIRAEARCIPAEPEVDERGLRMEMWLPR